MAQATTDNHRQLPGTSVGEARVPDFAEAHHMSLCKTKGDAIRLCCQLSGLSDEAIAGHLNIDKGHFSRMMRGRRAFPDFKTTALMELCGNLAPLQFEAQRMGYVLVPEAAIFAAQRRAA